MTEIEQGMLIDDRYRVKARIGSGGMADVFLAEDELLNRDVAVKVLHHRFVEDEDLIERFRREASAAASLSHPNVVAIFDRGSWNGTYYIAMEYLPGRTLKQLIREGGPLPAEQAIDIAIDVLKAVGFAHRKGIIHRDIKPHNVILGEEGRVSVTDFGIARAGPSEMTHTGSIMGTAQYLSPEQARGGQVDATSDIYAVGILLYELLTASVPFEGESAVAIALQHLSAEPAAPSSLNPAIPPQLDAVVLRALAKEQSERYASADELIAALRALRAQLSMQDGENRRSTTQLGGQVAPIAAAVAVEGIDPPGARASAGTAGLLPLPASNRPDANNATTGANGAHRGGGSVGGPAGTDSKRRRNRYIWAGAIAILAAAGILTGLLLDSPAGEVTVPNVVGLALTVAEGQVRNAGLVPFAQSARSTATPGTVIAQQPKAASISREGARVVVTVSAGNVSEVVPNVAGQTSARALAILKQHGFLPEAIQQSNSTVPAGRVIGTNPTAEVDAIRGAHIDVYVSSGPANQGAQKGQVPGVVGLERHSAEEAIAAAGLKTGTVNRQQTPHSAPGIVIAQSPTAGTQLSAGQIVNLTIAESPSELLVPNVVGKNQTTAAAMLGEAGLTPRSRTETVSSSSEVGIVLEQSPAAGQKVKRRSDVTIVVGAAAQTNNSTATTTTSSEPAPAGQLP